MTYKMKSVTQVKAIQTWTVRCQYVLLASNIRNITKAHKYSNWRVVYHAINTYKHVYIFTGISTEVDEKQTET
jgi:hypothetical protein